MHLDSLHRLRVFVAVAETKSFSKAAELLLISQPGVSNQVREIEHQIGSRLFDRLGHTIALTETGFAFLERAREVLGAAARLENTMEEARVGHGGQLRLAASTSWLNSLATALAQFRNAYPGRQVKLLRERRTPEVAELVLKNEVHLGFASVGPFTQLPKDERLDCVPVTEDEILLVAARSHPLANQKPGRFMEGGSPLPFVHRIPVEVGCAPHALESLAARADTVIEVEGYEAERQAILAGVGVGMVTRSSVSEELANGDLVPLAVEGAPYKITLCALRNKARPISKTQQVFLTCVMKVASARASEEGQGPISER